MSVPQFLVNMLINQYGEEITKQIIEGYEKNRFVTFRVNTIKTTVEAVKKELEKNKIEFENVVWSREAFIIKNVTEKEIQGLTMYKDGQIYLQSLSSMLPPIILKPQENNDILDMCSAPGGKTTQLATLTNNNAHITACELNTIRLEKLKYNIEKQGASSVYIMQTDSRKIDNYFSFDQILLDVPCSRKWNIRFAKSKFRKNIYRKINK